MKNTRRAPPRGAVPKSHRVMYASSPLLASKTPLNGFRGG